MFKIKLLFSIFLGISFLGKSQIDDENIRLKVLRKNLIRKEFVFGKWTENGGTETHLKYLGKVKTSKGGTFKILTSVWIWGMSTRHTSRILIFNEKNQYLGNYYVITESLLPAKLENGNLIFENSDADCDKNITSKISFRNKLPEKFFRRCNKKYGDIFSFDGTN